MSYPKQPWPERFWKKVEKTDGCWLWRGTMEVRGYGVIGVDGKLKKAHRLAYELTVGEIPRGFTIDHLCGNTLCVRPAHLEPVTNHENLRRYAEKCRLLGVRVLPKQFGKNAIPKRRPGVKPEPKQYCKQGHKLCGDNILIDGSTKRCRTCRNLRQKAAYYRRIGKPEPEGRPRKPGPRHAPRKRKR